MGKDDYTIIYEKDGVNYKLCKIFFGADGSYYVTSPYHPARKAVLAKATVNYTLPEMVVPFEEMIDLASADDDKKRLKLSHHPDGFLQFSGEGIVSGKDPEGHIRGVGVISWPLDAPVSGPAFGMALRGVEHFARRDRKKGKECIFHHSALTPMPGANVLALEGYYCPPLWRRFIQTEPDGTKSISLVHPAGVVLRLKVIFAPEGCAIPGFIGLELYTQVVHPDDTPSPSFVLSGSTGNLRYDEQGELLGDGIFCCYPRESPVGRRSVDYFLANIPYNLEPSE